MFLSDAPDLVASAQVPDTHRELALAGHGERAVSLVEEGDAPDGSAMLANLRSSLPVATSHNRIDLSRPAENWLLMNSPPLPESARLPSGEKATLRTKLAWPSKRR